MARAPDNEQLPPVEGADGWFALAPPPDTTALGELLQRLRAGGQSVRGFVDRATLLAAWLELPAPLVVLEWSRSRTSISVAARATDGASLRRQVSLPGGARALTSAWLELARATLVQQTRFDPLHDLRHEARLRAELPRLAAAAAHGGQAGLAIEAATGQLELQLTRDQFAAAAAAVLQPLAAALRSLAAVNGNGTLLVPEAMLEIPGITAVLDGARFARALRFDAGLVTRALQQLPASPAAAGGAVPYRTQLPLLAGPAPAPVLVPLELPGTQPEVMATHVVYRGRAVPLTADGVVLGRDAAQSTLPLPEGSAGLSRRHCTLRREAGRSQVIDHSHYGTWLDGARVRGRALLPAGSTLRLGEPGVELQLVALEGA